MVGIAYRSCVEPVVSWYFAHNLNCALKISMLHNLRYSLILFQFKLPE